jgi:hypothetical protein
MEPDFDADNVFGFMDDSNQNKPAADNVPVHDLTEDSTYLMEFGFGNGFVWNEEVLLVRIFIDDSRLHSQVGPHRIRNSLRVLVRSMCIFHLIKVIGHSHHCWQRSSDRNAYHRKPKLQKLELIKN